MPDSPIDLRLRWVRSTGVELAHDTAAVNGATYYAELLPNGDSCEMWVGVEWDGTDDSDYTLESAGKSRTDLTSYAAAGTGWTSQATALGTLSSAASASCGEWQVTAVPRGTRWRIKRVVTTGGVATARLKRY